MKINIEKSLYLPPFKKEGLPIVVDTLTMTPLDFFLFDHLGEEIVNQADGHTYIVHSRLCKDRDMNSIEWSLVPKTEVELEQWYLEHKQELKTYIQLLLTGKFDANLHSFFEPLFMYFESGKRIQPPRTLSDDIAHTLKPVETSRPGSILAVFGYNFFHRVLYRDKVDQFFIFLDWLASRHLMHLVPLISNLLSNIYITPNIISDILFSKKKTEDMLAGIATDNFKEKIFQSFLDSWGGTAHSVDIFLAEIVMMGGEVAIADIEPLIDQLFDAKSHTAGFRPHSYREALERYERIGILDILSVVEGDRIRVTPAITQMYQHTALQEQAPFMQSNWKSLLYKPLENFQRYHTDNNQVTMHPYWSALLGGSEFIQNMLWEELSPSGHENNLLDTLARYVHRHAMPLRRTEIFHELIAHARGLVDTYIQEHIDELRATFESRGQIFDEKTQFYLVTFIQDELKRMIEERQTEYFQRVSAKDTISEMEQQIMTGEEYRAARDQVVEHLKVELSSYTSLRYDRAFSSEIPLMRSMLTMMHEEIKRHPTGDIAKYLPNQLPDLTLFDPKSKLLMFNPASIYTMYLWRLYTTSRDILWHSSKTGKLIIRCLDKEVHDDMVGGLFFDIAFKLERYFLEKEFPLSFTEKDK